MATKFNYEQWEQYLKIDDIEETVASLDNILFTAVMRLLDTDCGRSCTARPNRCVERAFPSGKPSQVHQPIIYRNPRHPYPDAGDFRCSFHSPGSPRYSKNALCCKGVSARCPFW